ncbi:MAG: noncanonical pyrimidine nucleotidase, YjjG family [Bacteroidetes bacterium RIFCSPLOWO2_12_FULL_35_15]|nr:MAG: noncanonical pyrimidine nucleotidase, YjjG family [Bacteroidetes bacterium RIFCSPLOWO2_12_FULL_35_15]
MSDYEHIFFDLDRTLWDFETNSHETLSELIQKHKLPEKGIESASDFITEYLIINEQLWDEYRKGDVDKNTLRYDRFYRTLLKFKIDDRLLSQAIGNDYVITSPLKTGLFPHTKEVLDYLNANYNLHIITNGFEEVQHVKIKNCGIEKYFDQVITSERAGFKKPDVRIFEYSLATVNCNATNSLMIGDSLEADIIGARNAGIHQVYFNPKKEPHSEDVTFEISSLKELINFL